VKDSIFIILAIIFVVIGVSWKLLAPQSGVRSRLFGGVIELKAPDGLDIDMSVVMGRGDKIKYVSYYDLKGNINLVEYSDYGVLDAHYRIKLRHKVKSGKSK